MPATWSTPIALQAAALSFPRTDDHPNRLPFKGILTRLDQPSDSAPHGSDNRRIIVTKGAAIGAVSSLLGMGLNVAAGLAGHNVQFKIGIITSADVDGDAIRIGGYLYAADFPREALEIVRNQSDLGFSFEAQQIKVEDQAADPLTITSCCFTGAAILHKTGAAFTTTSIAAAAASDLSAAIRRQLPPGLEREFNRRLEAAGITSGRPLSGDQLKVLVDRCKNVGERMGVKQAALVLGYWPPELAT